MKRLRYVVVTVLLVVAFTVSIASGPGAGVAGDPELLTIIGATPEQEATLREITAWPAVPDLARTITVNVCEDCPNIGGATGMTISSFIPDPEYIGWIFLHEYGHVWDYQFLSPENRAAIIELNDVPYGWYSGPYLEQPVERFASTFGVFMMDGEGYQVFSPWVALSPPFTDIGDKSQEMQDAIVWLYNEGITKGATFTTYEPDEPVTRGQMALFLQRVLSN